MTPNPAGATLQGENCEAIPGPAQFKLRTPVAIVHAQQLKRRARVVVVNTGRWFRPCRRHQ
eukprot:13461005-Alexandrium_andersonii.AAC.1